MPTLVVVAHPDDEVLGCGGTIARMAGRGEEVFVHILSDGESSRYQDPTAVPGGDVLERQKAAIEACAILGAKPPRFGDLPDNRFDTVPLLEITKRVESVIDSIKPETIFTHHSGDMNVDHRLVAQAVQTATRPLPESTVERVYAFEVLSSSHIAAGQFGGPFVPNTFVDIEDTLQRKLEAMAVYKREVRPFPHPRSLESIRALAVTRGTICGLKAAESFVLVRRIER